MLESTPSWVPLGSFILNGFLGLSTIALAILNNLHRKGDADTAAIAELVKTKRFNRLKGVADSELIKQIQQYEEEIAVQKSRKIDLLRGMREKTERLAFLYFLEGIKAESVGDFASSSELYAASISEHPSYNAWKNQASVLRYLGKLPEALEAIESARNIQREYFDVDDPDIHMNLGNIYDDLRDSRRSFEEYGIAEDLYLQQRGEVPIRLLLNKAVALRRDNNPEGAMKVYDHVLERVEEEEDALTRTNTLINMSSALAEMDQLEKAEDLLTEYMKQVEQHSLVVNPMAYANLGVIRMFQGKNEEAIELIKNAVQIRRKLGYKDDPRWIMNIANSYSNIDEFKLAEKYYFEAMDANAALGYEPDPYISFNLSSVMLQQGKVDKALSYVNLSLSEFEKSGIPVPAKVQKFIDDTFIEQKGE